MQFDGNTSDPISPLAFAISIGCDFVARAFSGDKEHLVEIMKQAINYNGYALIDVLQPCIAFNKVNTLKWYKDRVYKIDDSNYDSKDRVAAFQKALEWGDSGIPLGILYKQEKNTYFDRVNYLKEGPALIGRQWKPQDAELFMEDFR